MERDSAGPPESRFGGRRRTGVDASSRPILGLRVDSTTYGEAASVVLGLARNGTGGYVCVSTVHVVMEAFDDVSFRDVVNQAIMVTPDGVTPVWGLRLFGKKDAQRVYGPTLTPIICEKAAENKIPVGFYGGTQEVVSRMVKK